MPSSWHIRGLADGYIHAQSTIDHYINQVAMEATTFPWGNAWTACFIELDYGSGIRPNLTTQEITCPRCIAHESTPV